MIEVIPAIIPKSFEELKEKAKLVEPYVEWVQFDVMDGQFVDNTTWNNPSDLKNLETNLKLEVHLLIQNPELVINDWIESGVVRVVFHYSSTEKHQEIIEKIKKAGLQVGIAINPEVSIDVLDTFINQLDLVLVMTVNPGWNGQEFMEDMLGKIKQLRDKYSDVNIGVDGGVNTKTASSIIQAGANILFSGSAILNSNNIKETIWKLKN